MGEVPHTPYYGTHDATPLFLVLLDEYERWTGDLELVRRLEPAARAALRWVQQYGDPDGDGYLEFRTRSSEGLINQGWKDSWNSSLFADGRIAEPPIAICEVQGYANDARLRTAPAGAAGLAGLGRPGTRGPSRSRGRRARPPLQSEKRPAAVVDRLDFWSARRGHFVHALDCEKRQVDALTSNIGRLLWSGIVDGRELRCSQSSPPGPGPRVTRRS
jgi:glycogen debranching enzyme